MKKLIYVAVALIALSSCSKESDSSMSKDVNKRAHQAQLSVSEGFIVGTVGQNGATISYDLSELEAIAACAVSESDASGLAFTLNQDGNYFLTGQGSSDGSYTTFAVQMITDGDDLVWSSQSNILTCETESSTPCTLTLETGLDYSCSNASGGQCTETPISGAQAKGEPCNWPWMVKSSK